jgi:hypothetical protein
MSFAVANQEGSFCRALTGRDFGTKLPETRSHTLISMRLRYMQRCTSDETSTCTPHNLFSFTRGIDLQRSCARMHFVQYRTFNPIDRVYGAVAVRCYFGSHSRRSVTMPFISEARAQKRRVFSILCSRHCVRGRVYRFPF